MHAGNEPAVERIPFPSGEQNSADELDSTTTHTLKYYNIHILESFERKAAPSRLLRSLDV